MTNKYLTSLTEEQRQEMRAKAEATRLEKVEWAKNNLKMEYADEKLWEELARGAKIRLPQKHLPNSELKHIKRIARRLNVDVSDYVKAQGSSTLKAMMELNPTWTARAECGLFLEWLEEEGLILVRG